MTVAALMVSAAVLSWALTGWLRRYAMSRHLMDVPNARSSHSAPTPRGGGVAIVVSFLVPLPLLVMLDWLEPSLALALAGGGLGVAVLGFLDDHGHVAARWRLLGHFLAAGWALYWLGGLPALVFAGFSIELGVFGHFLALVYLVWLLNLYNFMDGIDGIASVEAISVCLGAVLLTVLVGGRADLLPMLLLASAVAGFLVWNFPPAKIFMGDAGSGFLGLVLGILSLYSAWMEAELLWGWLILLGVFVVDATFTLLRRLLRGDRIYEAHRSHAYQCASRALCAHKPVTLMVLAINSLWLLPMALLVGLGYLSGLAGLVLAYTPLVALAVHYRAGTPEVVG